MKTKSETLLVLAHSKNTKNGKGQLLHNLVSNPLISC